MAIKIRPIHNADYEAWLSLWDGNNMDTRDEAVTAQTWARLIDENSPVNGLVAEKDGTLIGLVHYILHPTTGSLHDVCYMQDVYVAPESRKGGVARRMVEQLAVLGMKKRWSRLYWLADGKNAAAQSLYKNIGVKLDFTLHILKLD